ncbi:carboxyl-terminal protease [Candidatus Moduliflexus flocculans]|uniref:Carboxyl-terminal protease n=1 Tax=Candidatus Moduliflexus flocculans TaxID=1499966 RepID=A0A0S6W411_9BACT|nr:carboxyl-terminal protease [Candidatus Moduliflexus flocculans]
MRRPLKSHQIIVLIIALFAAVIMGASVGVKVQAFQSETYEKLKIFDEVLYLIQTNYVEEVNVQDLIYGGINGMMKTLDPHSSFMPPELYEEMRVETQGNFGGLGIQIGIRDDQLTVISPIDDTPAFRAGILAGDTIVKIDDKSTKDMTLTEAVKLLRGPKGSKVTISIMREGFTEPKDFTMTRDIIELQSVTHQMLEDKIGYVRLRQFQENTANDLESALKDLEDQDMEALIMDLRSNPGGLLNSAVEVADKFLEKGKLIVYTEGRKSNQDMRFVAHEEFTHPNYPMVILVNHGSASASEIVAGALKAHSRAVLVGTQTYGKGSVQSVIPLSDNSGLRLTTAKYYTPDGKSIHEKGITPDIIVQLDKPVTPPPATNEPAKKDTQEVVEDENDAEPDTTTTVQPDETEPGELPKENGDAETAAIEKFIKEDSQLSRAVDLLRGILIFERQSI